MNISIIILGAGGHAKVLIDFLQAKSNVEILGILETNPYLFGRQISGISILGSEEKIKQYSPDNVQLLNGLGSIDIPVHRKSIFNKFKMMGYQFFSAIHPSALVASTAQLGEGIQLMAGSIVQSGCMIGDNVIVNTRATIDHDTVIGHHTHLAPGVLISGHVSIGEESHIGAGSTIIQNITIDNRCLVGAGSVVIRHVASGARVAGVPAKQIGVNA